MFVISSLCCLEFKHRRILTWIFCLFIYFCIWLIHWVWTCYSSLLINFRTVSILAELKSSLDHTPNLVWCIPLSGLYVMTFSRSVLCRDILYSYLKFRYRSFVFLPDTPFEALIGQLYYTISFELGEWRYKQRNWNPACFQSDAITNGRGLF